MHERDAIYHLWKHSEKSGLKSALATVVEVKGSAYRRPGARMLLVQCGRSAGVINGGCLDGDLQARAQMVMATGIAQLACYDTTAAHDIVFGLGLGCRGVVKILIEPAENLQWLVQNETVAVVFEVPQGTQGQLGSRRFEAQSVERPQIMETAWGRAFVERLEPPQVLAIFGAGADVVPLQTIGRTLGWDVQVVDLRAPNPSRPVYLDSNFVPPEHLTELAIPEGAACVIMTHNFLHDLELLKKLLPSSAAYIGILGPRRRTDELLEKIGGDTLLRGVTPTEQQLSRLFAPVGLDLGAETPEEIALSIVAEIQRVKRDKTAQSLRERGNIH